MRMPLLDRLGSGQLGQSGRAAGEMVVSLELQAAMRGAAIEELETHGVEHGKESRVGLLRQGIAQGHGAKGGQVLEEAVRQRLGAIVLGLVAVGGRCGRVTATGVGRYRIVIFTLARTL